MAAAMLGGEGCHHVDVTPKATRKATKPAHAKHATPRSSRPEAFPAAGAGGADGAPGPHGAPLVSSWPGAPLASSLCADPDDETEGRTGECNATFRVMLVFWSPWVQEKKSGSRAFTTQAAANTGQNLVYRFQALHQGISLFARDKANSLKNQVLPFRQEVVPDKVEVKLLVPSRYKIVD